MSTLLQPVAEALGEGMARLRALIRKQPPALLPFVGLVMIAVLTSTALLGSLVMAMDSNAADEKLRMLRNALSREQSALSEATMDYARWDDAVTHVYGGLDRQWLATNFQGTIPLYIIDGRGNTLYAARPDQRYA